MRKVLGMLPLGMLVLATVASPAWAGDAWQAKYRVRDAEGERTLVVVRDETQVEYRMSGQAPRVWRKLQDGVEMRELHRREARMVTYTPGDLRTMGMPTEWDALAEVVAPEVRAQLSARGQSSRLGQSSLHYQGADAQGKPVVLEWLPGVGLPALYCTGAQACLKNPGKHAALELLALRTLPAAQAFSSTEGLLEIDQADLGDMEMDPVVHALVHDGHTAH